MGLWGVGNGNKLLEIKYHHFSSSPLPPRPPPTSPFKLTYELIPQSVSILQLWSGDNQAVDEGQENSSAMIININNLTTRKCPTCRDNSDENVYKDMLGQYNTTVGVSECRGMPPAIDKGFNLTKISLGLSVSHVTSASPVFVCLGLLQLLNNNVELVALGLVSLKYKSDHCSH